MTDPLPIIAAAARSSDMTDCDPEIITKTGAIAAPVIQATDLRLKIIVKVVTDAQQPHGDNKKTSM